MDSKHEKAVQGCDPDHQNDDYPHTLARCGGVCLGVPALSRA
jgi:hypothetical protein